MAGRKVWFGTPANALEAPEGEKGLMSHYVMVSLCTQMMEKSPVSVAVVVKKS